MIYIVATITAESDSQGLVNKPVEDYIFHWESCLRFLNTQQTFHEDTFIFSSFKVLFNADIYYNNKKSSTMGSHPIDKVSTWLCYLLYDNVNLAIAFFNLLLQMNLVELLHCSR